jgi:acetyl-CoA carboxylase biotin carboxyl carrier protein
MNVNLKQLRALLRLLEKRNVSEFEFEDEHARFRLVRGDYSRRSLRSEPPASLSIPAPAALSVPAAGPTGEEQIFYVTSPFVGTFYRSASPDAPPFVEVGSQIREGQALCIIEAMKLMNEIEADCAGTILDVFVENGKSVEFGQKLFRVHKD